MTTILKFPVKNYFDPDKLPDEVVEWMMDHDECKIPELNFHAGYHVFIFYDDMSATEFKLRFRQLFGKANHYR